MKGEPGQVIPGPPGIDGMDGETGEQGLPGIDGAKGEKGICCAQWYMNEIIQKANRKQGVSLSFRIVLKDQEGRKVFILHSDIY